MINSELVAMLRCPATLAPLEIASDSLLATINAAIAQQQVKNRLGQPVTEPIECGLVARSAVLYPVRNGIPILLVDEAISLDALPQPPAVG